MESVRTLLERDVYISSDIASPGLIRSVGWE